MKNSIKFIVGFIIILPVAVLVLWALGKDWLYPQIVPAEFSLKFIQQMVKDPNFVAALLNSVYIAFAATFLTLIIALPTAKFLAFQHFLPRRFVELIIYLALILPGIAIITSSQTVFLQMRLTGTFTGLILIHSYFMLPYALQILLESYRKMGFGYSETAKVLGATNWQTFISVTFPLLKPGILAAGNLIYFVSFSQYLPTFFIGGGRIITLPMLLLPYANNGRFGIASSYSLLFLVVSLIAVGLIKKGIGGKKDGLTT
ncbi:ABC transporter permease [Enterococcus sp. AZ103]|uniref:ABC transporter permease n=1 Tax=Enterococcus sp. AZ103 TaxID=2774628 RepID=UPI003F1E8337